MQIMIDSTTDASFSPILGQLLQSYIDHRSISLFGVACKVLSIEQSQDKQLYFTVEGNPLSANHTTSA